MRVNRLQFKAISDVFNETTGDMILVDSYKRPDSDTISITFRDQGGKQHRYVNHKGEIVKEWTEGNNG